MAHALSRQRRAHPDPRARRLRPAGRRELGSGRGLEAPALPRRRSAGSTSAAASSVRTRTTASAATRSSGAACSTGCGARTSRRSSTSTASRRRGRSTTTRSRRTTTAPSGCITCAAQHGVDPTEPPRGPFPYPPVPHAAGDGGDRRAAARARGCIPSPLPLGLLRPGEADGCMLCNTCNSFAVQAAREERRRRLLRAPGDGAAERHAVDQRARAPADDRSVRPAGSRRVEVERDGETRARRRRRWSSCRAARSTPRRCCCDRRATAHPERPGEFVGPGRPALHGAPGDDDAGLPSVPQERRRCSRRRWRSTTSTCAARDTPYPLGQIQSQGRTHGVMAQTVVPVDSAVGRTRRGSRAASTGWRCPRICRAPTTA